MCFDSEVCVCLFVCAQLCGRDHVPFVCTRAAVFVCVCLALQLITSDYL